MSCQLSFSPLYFSAEREVDRTFVVSRKPMVREYYQSQRQYLLHQEEELSWTYLVLLVQELGQQ